MDLSLSAPPNLRFSAPEAAIDGNVNSVVGGLACIVESLNSEAASLDFHKPTARDLQNAAKSFFAQASGIADELQQQTRLPVAFAVPTEQAESLLVDAGQEVQRIRKQGVVSRKRHYAKDEGYLRAVIDALRVLERFLAFDKVTTSSSRRVHGREKKLLSDQSPLQRHFLPVATGFDSFKTVLLGLSNMADGLPWPLKAIPQTISQLIAQAETFASLHDKCIDLVDRSISLHRVMAGLFFESNALSPALEKQVFAFFSHFQLLVLRVEVIEAVNTVRQFISANRIDEYIKSEGVHVSEILAEITAIFTVDTNIAIRLNESVAEKRHNQLIGLIDGASATGVISDSSVPPPQPVVFHGRQESVADLVRHLDNDSTSHVVILGAGGIGKSSVALVVLHDPKMVARFGARRHFVSCEGMRHADSVALTLARILGSKRDGAERDPLAAIRDGLAKPTILTIDNLESIWVTDEPKTRRDTERLLQTLGNMDNLSLIVTSRGSIPPPGVKWANARSTSLDTLTVEAALAVFSDLAGESIAVSNEASQAMKQLVTEVDCMPLAVSLLAQLARNGESPLSLLRQWESKRSRLLQTEATGREYNVEVSISITLDFLPSAEVNPEPVRLLAICSELPAGLFPGVMDDLRASFDDIDAAARLLRKHSLVQTGAHGQLKMLSPIRHFVKTRYAVTDVHRAALIEFYCKLARKANQPVDENFPAALRLVTPELENIAWILHAAVDTTTALTSTVVEGVLDYSWFTYHTIPATSLLESLIVRLRTTSGRKRELGRSLRLCGDMCRMRFRHDDAARYLNDAAAIFAGLEDVWGHAECSMCLGLVYVSRLRYSEAEHAFRVAMDGFVLTSDGLSISQCQKSMADLASATGDEESALELLKSAANGFAIAGHNRGVALCDKNIGIASLTMGDLHLALEKLNAARAVLEGMGDIHGLAQCNEAIAEAHVAGGTFDEATIALDRARTLLARAGERITSERLGKTLEVISECVESSGITWEQVRSNIWNRRPPKWYRVPQPSITDLSLDYLGGHSLDHGLSRSNVPSLRHKLSSDDGVHGAFAAANYSISDFGRTMQPPPQTQPQPQPMDPGLNWTHRRRQLSISSSWTDSDEERENNSAPIAAASFKLPEPEGRE